MSTDTVSSEAVPMPPPTPEECHEINELMRAVRTYTHPVVFNTKNPHLGTAVFLRHGERLFAFTAAHNVHEDTMFHFRLTSASDRRVFKVLSDYIHPNYDPEADTSKYDLAILELEPNPAVPSGDVAQLYTGGFKKGEGECKIVGNAFFWVVGFPAELAKMNGGNILLRQTTFCTQILEHSPDELSLLYPESGYQVPQNGTVGEIGDLPSTPKGYSGGGVWMTVNPPGELFNPLRHIKLVGIETHWSPRSRLARCVPSNVIAEALKAFKPELDASQG